MKFDDFGGTSNECCGKHTLQITDICFTGIHGQLFNVQFIQIHTFNQSKNKPHIQTQKELKNWKTHY